MMSHWRVYLVTALTFAAVTAGMPPRIVSSTSLALFVNASTGSDNNDGLSSGTALATVPAACAKLLKFHDAAVTITLDNGRNVYQGCDLSPFLGKSGSTKATLAISAPLVNATDLSSGTATGTATSTITGTGVTFTQLCDTSGQTFQTAGVGLAGKYMLTVGASSYAIASNTSTCITINDTANLGATPAYAIQVPGAKFNTNAAGTYCDNSDVCTRGAVFWSHANDGPAGNTALSFSGVEFSGGTRAAAVWSGVVSFTNVTFTGTASTPIAVYGTGARVKVRASGLTDTAILVHTDPGAQGTIVSVRTTSIPNGGALFDFVGGSVGYVDAAFNRVNHAGTGTTAALCGVNAGQFVNEQYICGAACIDNRDCNGQQPAPAALTIEGVTLTASANTWIAILGAAGSTHYQIDKIGIFGTSTLDASPKATARIALADQQAEIALSTSTTITPSASGGVFCTGLNAIDCYTASQLAAMGSVVHGNDGSTIQYLTASAEMRSAMLTPTATGSLPTCQAAPTGGSATQGLEVFDSTANRAKVCGTDNTYHQVLDSLDLPLSIANGGTNNGSLGVTAGGVIYADGTKLQNTGAGTSGQCLVSNGASAPSFSSCSSGTTELVDVLFSGAGALTLNQTLGGTVFKDATTLNGINYRVTAVTGSGGTTGLVIKASDGTNTCTFTRSCAPTANSNVRVTAANGAGTGCAFAPLASATWTVDSTSDCTTYPVLLDLIKVEGTR